MPKRLFIALLLSLFALQLQAFPLQEKGIIVQYSEPCKLSLLQEQTRGHFASVVALNPEQTLILYRFNPALLAEYKAIELIRETRHYLLHQADGPLYPRTTSPNDSLFFRQWHLPVIRATEAWDINRRGCNLNGDTIVIAVIDDGLHVNHPDFQGNIWVNYADTAGNGLDDDGNGYVDDTYGWNFMSANNDISDSTYYAAGHGTPVAGIIGARGNNRTGVTGIMWHVKLMIVNIADSGWSNINTFQSDAIRAYSYVLHQRKLYNRSGGKQGAFVVAGNSSWGVDGRKAHEAPLWCAMYDSLGKYGVLSVGSVSNIQSEDPVEARGDLPTLCPSNHLLTVSSSSASDQLFSSGYSTVSVDLSAPGAGIFSTAAYTRYNILNQLVYKGGFNGTSFAAPMVTAAIGVLHANACERILDSMQVSPARTNFLLRKFILDGVDKTDGLLGKSVTGGRLNIKRSLELMQQYCMGYTGLSGQTVSAEAVLYPNPGNGQLEILSNTEPEAVQCLDACGRPVPFVYQNGQILLQDAAAGVYFIVLSQAGFTQRLKYLKSE